MRSAAPLLLVLLAAGCRSAPETRAEPPRHDYLSNNRSSVEFLAETARDGRQLRRENLRCTLRFRPRIREGLAQQRMGRAFAAETVFADMWREGGQAWEDLKGAFRWDRREFSDSLRFGHLDRGD